MRCLLSLYVCKFCSSPSHHPVTLTRKALRDFKFSDGTVIPKNTFVCAASLPIHHDKQNYADADVFDGFRFADMRMSEGDGMKHQLVCDTYIHCSDLFTVVFLNMSGCHKYNLSAFRTWQACMVCISTTTFQDIGVDVFLCSPGRFFAANELKAMLSHLVLTYDIRLEDEGVRPIDLWFGGSCRPNQTAEVLFRKRQS